MTSFHTNVLLTTTGGTKKEAASDHKDVGAKWRARPEVTDVEFDGDPVDFNNDVEGFGEWTTSFEIWLDATDERSARTLIESLLEAEKDWNCSGEIVSLDTAED